MRTIKLAAMGLLIVASYNCKQFKQGMEDGKKAAQEEAAEAAKEMKEEIAEIETIKFKMEPKSESTVTGDVTFTEEGGKVTMMAVLTGLTPGEHAIHIHDKADCSSADGKSTGGHWNPTNTPHGKWGAEEGYHKGDIGNFTADADGNATIEFSTNEWCIGCDDDTKNIVGKGVIVHQGVDDFTSQPSGAAGARVSCTGIIQ
ncbi:superoxide dismutase family protein [Maribacter sp. 2308TA10-17]|uniref:superoxide dismutase family protein n=1 Tax=Maribacter sp. 2308TA10-17 TaxID=3386276 RepID=UPI0039BC3CE9